MMRAVISVSQRASKLPHAVLLMKSMDHSVLRQSQSLSLQFTRCFADERIKGAAGVNQGGIIGSVGSQATMGQASGAGDSATIQQMQGATFGNRSSSSDKLGKQQTEGVSKSGSITSQMSASASSSECGKIGTDESLAPSKRCSKQMGQTTTGSQTGGTVNNLAEDAVKQLQDAAANLPSKAQVEKFVFRVLAFLYDIIYLTSNWTIRFVNEKILQNTTVKYYWKRFHDKMEQAKKD